ncbi:MAG: hypothetical protein WC519_01795 [Parcubacteria group bacterium]
MKLKPLRWGVVVFIGITGWYLASVLRIGALSLFGETTIPFTNNLAGQFALIAVISFIVPISIAGFRAVTKDNKVKGRVGFNENSAIISLAGKKCQIPIKTNQHFLCREVFEHRDRRIDEIDILDILDWRKDGKRSVYDALLAVNKKAKRDLGINKLLEWQNNTVWLNDDFN